MAAAVCAEMLVHTQAPHFLQPGQLMDQVPMDVSISRGQGEEASRQHNTSAQSVLSTQATPAAGQQQAADQLQANSVGASTAENSISRAFSGMQSIKFCALCECLPTLITFMPPLCTSSDATAVSILSQKASQEGRL